MSEFDFDSFLDSIYFEGYAEQLQRQHPDEYIRQYEDYLKQYSLTPAH